MNRLGIMQETGQSNLKGRIKTPTKEGYEIFKNFKAKMREEIEEKKLPIYMQSKFK